MSSKTKKRPALGKGLSALLENSETDITATVGDQGSVVGSIAMLAIESIEANPFNPRTNFERESLEELSESILAHGIIQPLTVRKLGRDKYQLISGERRFRASQLAKISEVPAYIRIANDQAMLEMALVENIQREDLNPIEVAFSYQRLIEECNLTQDQLGQKISKSRTSVTNHLRLLKLPPEIQAGVKSQSISMGHARALVSAGSQAEQVLLFNRVVSENLSVRELEGLIRGEEPEARTPKNVKSRGVTSKVKISADENAFKERLGDQLSTKIEIKKSSNGTGKLIVTFNSDIDLGRIIGLLNK